jgi:hypothetical protein
MNKYLKLYGASRYPKPPEIVEHDDFSIAADPDTFRKLSNFFLQCAAELENIHGDATNDWHRHFRDFSENWTEDMCDLVVCAPPVK